MAKAKKSEEAQPAKKVKRYSQDEKRAAVQDLEISGDAQLEVAERHGISVQSLINWKKKFGDGTLEGDPVPANTTAMPHVEQAFRKDMAEAERRVQEIRLQAAKIGIKL